MGSPLIRYNISDISHTHWLRSQYEKLGNDWRAINQIIWQIPTAAIAITTGIIIAAYQQYLVGLPRIFILIIGSLLLFSLAVESVKKRLHMDAIGVTIDNIEKEIKEPSIVKTHFSDNVYNEIKKIKPDYSGNNDFVLYLYKKSHARQALTHVIFYAGIGVSALAVLEIIAQDYNSKLDATNSLWIAGLIVIGSCFICEVTFFFMGKIRQRETTTK